MARYDSVGVDLVAMCVDDVVCSGAAPLFFLDYVAVGRLDPSNVAELVGGVAAGCRTAGCALVGGETAEHPGLLEADEFDLAGCCVGVVERDRLLDGSAARAGDAIVGIASTGLHANGFSLVRMLIAQFDLDLRRPYQEQLVRTLGDAGRTAAIGAEPELELATLGDVLLTPTAIYTPAILRLREALVAAGADLHGVAHITGGGLPANIPRALPTGLGAEIDPSRWSMPSIMRLLAEMGGLTDAELRATFNGGLGMIVVVAPSAVEATIGALAGAGFAAWQVGAVRPIEALGGERYREGRPG
jgi:phosphoribosylformylglycinamidine cyclo-ligase